jgi:hypothetical protein
MPENNRSNYCRQINQPQVGVRAYLSDRCREMVFEVIDRAEKDLNVKDKLLGHTYGVQILPVADLPQHI